ncbi:plasmid pRiA4b ORF-3 family protein [Pengzhenrongella phosphoraccumulans]|uniref:plasmid pRiA4b ORF-3 family protein n=1 Tax=Pengzhenrongella phosphoraccumulans TaxID=3114394 RepID=UPI003890B5EF
MSDLESKFNAVIAGLGLNELRDLAAQVVGLGRDGAAQEPTTRRRPPRAEPATFVLTIDLDDADPRIWRQLEVASDLRLDALHTVLQVAMGWTDSHLHQFASGDSYQDPMLERFLTAADLEEGESGVPEADVRLDELVQDVGDCVLYTYDFGDGWDHTVRLDAVRPLPDGDSPSRYAVGAPARCLDGAGACPPEDCGGVWNYQELVAAAATPTTLDPDERAAQDRLLEHYFPGVPRSRIADAAARFDLDEVNAELARPPLPKPIADLVRRAHGPGELDLADMLARARLDGPVLIDTAVAERMVAPFAWLVRHVGARGLPLTDAGYLRPADVVAVADAIGITDEWFGAPSRESQTYPVLEFRRAAQKLGLLRVARGRVHATKAGVKLADDPVGLWWHLATRLPLSGAPYGHDACLVALLAIAAGAGPAAQAAVMTAIGWERFDGEPMTVADVRGDARETIGVLERLGAFAPRAVGDGWNGPTTRDGATFARAALRAWP